jgi:DNA invertase Pin-like site-specific DNA recombinase
LISSASRRTTRARDPIRPDEAPIGSPDAANWPLEMPGGRPMHHDNGESTRRILLQETQAARMFLMVNKSGYKQMRKIGYARVSGTGQSLDRQIAALRAEQCDVIFREGQRPEHQEQAGGRESHDELGTGDVLVLAEWDRATRSMFHGLDIIQRVAARAALVKVLDRAYLDLTSTIGKGILAFLSALAQDERERILARCNAGRQIARAKGTRFGRKPKLTDHRQVEALRRLAAGRKLPIDRQDDGRAPRYDREAGWVGLRACRRRLLARLLPTGPID